MAKACDLEELPEAHNLTKMIIRKKLIRGESKSGEKTVIIRQALSRTNIKLGSIREY